VNRLRGVAAATLRTGETMTTMTDVDLCAVIDVLMIDQMLLSLVRCPIDGQQLTLAAAELTQTLNQRIEQRQLRDHVDALVEEPMDGALVTADAARAYPIRESIPTLIPAESIPLPADLRQLAQRDGGDVDAG
jgi:uncharacterized protein YbaR (Trm112 family)